MGTDNIRLKMILVLNFTSSKLNSSVSCKFLVVEFKGDKCLDLCQIKITANSRKYMCLWD